MTDYDAELRQLCRASRAFEGSSAVDRASVQEGLRVRHGIVVGAAAASAVALSGTSAAHGAGASTLAAAGAGAGTSAVSAGAAGGVAKVWLAKSTLIWFASGLAGGVVVAA